MTQLQLDTSGSKWMQMLLSISCVCKWATICWQVHLILLVLNALNDALCKKCVIWGQITFNILQMVTVNDHKLFFLLLCGCSLCPCVCFLQKLTFHIRAYQLEEKQLHLWLCVFQEHGPSCGLCVSACWPVFGVALILRAVSLRMPDVPLWPSRSFPSLPGWAGLLLSSFYHKQLRFNPFFSPELILALMSTTSLIPNYWCFLLMIFKKPYYMFS